MLAGMPVFAARLHVRSLYKGGEMISVRTCGGRSSTFLTL